MKKITQFAMLFIALFFMNTNLEAQSGDYEYLFNSTATDGTELEGWTSWGNGGGLTVANGVLTFDHGSNGVNIPVGNLVDKTNFPYVAIQVDQIPERLEFFMRTTDGIGGWYNETDVEADGRIDLWEYDATLNAEGVYYWNLNYEFWDNNGANADPRFEELTDGGTTNLSILRLSTTDVNDLSTSINWLKTFASVQAITDYAAANPFPLLGVNDFENASQTKIFSGTKKIDIQKLELNAKVQVFDLLGKSLFTSVSKSDDLSIDINTTGVYIVKIVGESSVITKKVIVK